MRIAYFDLVAGASGDMLLGALVDAGLPLADLQQALLALHLPGFALTQSKVMRGAFSATKVDVQVTETCAARRLADIEALVQGSELERTVQERALRIFRRMIDVEASIHNRPVDTVHLHELGALDTIVDVMGVLLGLRLLAAGRVYVSPVPLGRGMLNGSHGLMPLPAPATAALLRGVPVVGVDASVETVTPTAAALIAELADGFGPIPAMRLEAVGYGAGSRTVPEPNILRVFLGQAAAADEGLGEMLVLLETNIDDMSPEVHGYLLERLLAEGALDAYLTPLVMKKGRPGVLLSVLCRPEDAGRLRALVFAETSTLGIRELAVARHALPRVVETVATRFGPVRVKVASLSDGQRKAAPEYEDCRRAALEHRVPLRQVYEAALACWRATDRPPGTASQP